MAKWQDVDADLSRRQVIDQDNQVGSGGVQVDGAWVLVVTAVHAGPVATPSQSCPLQPAQD